VPIGPLNSIADIFEDLQFKARESMVTLEHPLGDGLSFRTSLRACPGRPEG